MNFLLLFVTFLLQLVFMHLTTSIVQLRMSTVDKR